MRQDHIATAGGEHATSTRPFARQVGMIFRATAERTLASVRQRTGKVLSSYLGQSRNRQVAIMAAVAVLIVVIATLAQSLGGDGRAASVTGAAPPPSSPPIPGQSRAGPIAAKVRPLAPAQTPVDEQLYLLLNLRYAYLFMPSDPADAAAFERELGESRYDANRYLAYAKSNDFDPRLVDLYSDLVGAIDLVTDVWVRSGRIGRDAVLQAEAIRNNAGTDAGVTVGASLATAGATGGGSLLVGAGQLVKQQQNQQTAVAQLDEAKQRAVEDARRESERKLSSLIAKAEVTAGELAKKKGWNVAETGLVELADDIKAMAQAGGARDQAAMARWAQLAAAKRPRDPVAFSLHSIFVSLIPGTPATTIAECGERCVYASSLIPAGTVFDKDRGVILILAATLLTNAAMDEARDADWAAQRSDLGTRAVELFDAADRYVNVAARDDAGDFRLSRAKALIRAGRLQEALGRADEVYNEKKSAPEYALTMAVLLGHLDRPDDALKWLTWALANCPDDIIGSVRTRPCLSPLRRAKPDAFADLTKVKYDWKIEWGSFNDDVILNNRSAFPVTNVVFTPRIENAGKVYTADLKVDRLGPGEAHRFVNAVSVAGSRYDKATSTLLCDQEGH